jgi:hypothetical protein
LCGCAASERRFRDFDQAVGALVQLGSNGGLAAAAFPFPTAILSTTTGEAADSFKDLLFDQVNEQNILDQTFQLVSFPASKPTVVTIFTA